MFPAFFFSPFRLPPGLGRVPSMAGPSCWGSLGEKTSKTSSCSSTSTTGSSQPSLGRVDPNKTQTQLHIPRVPPGRSPSSGMGDTLCEGFSSVGTSVLKQNATPESSPCHWWLQNCRGNYCKTLKLMGKA